MKRTLLTLIQLLLITLLVIPASAGNKKKKKDKKKEAYKFEVTIELPATSVKNQQRTGTCWAFATTSFIESELLRMDKGEQDLSEMFFVRYAYPAKAEEYVRKHGLGNFSQGGQAHDVMTVIKKYGFIPEEIYSGKDYKGKVHNHTEMVNMMKGALDGLLKSTRSGLTERWPFAINSILDAYLGEVPETFEYNGKTMSSQSYASRMMNFNADDYIEITSYNHHPYYKPFILEVPDNWSNNSYYNVPIDDLIKIMNHAIKSGYTVCWDGDVSDPGFSHKNGMAILPSKEWSEKDKDEREQLFVDYIPEREVSQEDRQENYNTQRTTDDHLMHIIGLAVDEHGTVYYITKNSWSDDSNDFGGKLNMSEAYIRLNTIAVMIHKDALPKDIRAQLGL